jgi:hypothetical protein
MAPWGVQSSQAEKNAHDELGDQDKHAVGDAANRGLTAPLPS